MATLTGTIRTIKRANSSVNGNPAFVITLDSGIAYRTQTDTGWAYEVDPSMIGKTFVFTLNTRGQIRFGKAVR